MGIRIVAILAMLAIALACQKISTKEEQVATNFAFEERLNCSMQYQYRGSKGTEYVAGPKVETVITGEDFKGMKEKTFVLEDAHFFTNFEARPEIILFGGGEVADAQKLIKLRLRPSSGLPTRCWA